MRIRQRMIGARPQVPNSHRASFGKDADRISELSRTPEIPLQSRGFRITGRAVLTVASLGCRNFSLENRPLWFRASFPAHATSAAQGRFPVGAPPAFLTHQPPQNKIKRKNEAVPSQQQLGQEREEKENVKRPYIDAIIIPHKASWCQEALRSRPMQKNLPEKQETAKLNAKRPVIAHRPLTEFTQSFCTSALRNL